MGTDTFWISTIAGDQCGIGVGSPPVPVFGLTADEFPLPEPAREIHARHEIMRHIGEETGMIPVLDQRFSNRGFIGRHGLPTRRINVVPRHGGIRAEWIRTSTGV